MKVAISVPDPLFEAADTLQLDSVYAKQNSSPDPVLLESALRTLDPNETW